PPFPLSVGTALAVAAGAGPAVRGGAADRPGTSAVVGVPAAADCGVGDGLRVGTATVAPGPVGTGVAAGAAESAGGASTGAVVDGIGAGSALGDRPPPPFEQPASRSTAVPSAATTRRILMVGLPPAPA